MKHHLPAMLFSLAILAGCATLSEDECKTADWYGIGLKDGRAGEPEARLDAHRKSCADFGIRPQERRYFDGRQDGLRDYCRLENALRTGLNGNEYKGVCPGEIDRQFRLYNSEAYGVYRLQQRIKEIGNQVSSKEQSLLDRDMTDKRRQQLREEIRDLDRQRERVRHDLYYQERELDKLFREAGLRPWQR